MFGNETPISGGAGPACWHVTRGGETPPPIALTSRVEAHTPKPCWQIRGNLAAQIVFTVNTRAMGTTILLVLRWSVYRQWWTYEEAPASHPREWTSHEFESWGRMPSSGITFSHGASRVARGDARITLVVCFTRGAFQGSRAWHRQLFSADVTLTLAYPGCCSFLLPLLVSNPDRSLMPRPDAII